MTAPTCGTCRWWSDQNDHQNILANMIQNAGEERGYYVHWDDAETQAEQVTSVRRCTSPKLLFYVLPQHGQAAVVDGSQYKGQLMTDAAFGCTNHEGGEHTPKGEG